MNAAFIKSGKEIRAYIQKKVRIDGRSTTQTIRRLGLLSDIQKEYGCDDPRQWVIDLAAKMTEEERLGKEKVTLDFYPGTQIAMGNKPLRHGGDMLLLPLYTGLGLKDICSNIMKGTRVKYDLKLYNPRIWRNIKAGGFNELSVFLHDLGRNPFSIYSYSPYTT